MSTNDPEKRSAAEEPGNARGDSELDASAFVDDLDALAAHLDRLERRLSAPASADGPGTVRLDPADIAELGRQIGARIRAQLDAGRPGVQNAGPGDDTEDPASARQPSIILEDWKHASSRPLQEGPQEQESGSDAKENGDLVVVRKCREALERLRRQGAAAGKSNTGAERHDAQKGDHDSDQVEAERRREGRGTRSEIMLQSARTKAYALHAAGRYDEASRAYQEYFDLLGSAYDDVSTLHASRECSVQANNRRKKAGRRRMLAVCFVVLLGLWIGGTLYVADRTVGSARQAVAHADNRGLEAYCDRLESRLFSAGSFGLVGYLYGPEIDHWRIRLEEAAPVHSAAMPVITNIIVMVEDTAGAPSRPAGTPVEEVPRRRDDAEAPVEAAAVVTNYLTPPILSLGLNPRGTEAVLYDSRFKKMAMEHGISILEPGGRYLLSATKKGCYPYLEPLDSDWQGVRRIDLILSRVDGKGRRQEGAEPGSQRALPGQWHEDGGVSIEELYRLMEKYEKRLLRKRLRQLKHDHEPSDDKSRRNTP